MNDEILRSALWAALEEDLNEIWNGPEPEPPEFSTAYLAWEEAFLASLSAERSPHAYRQSHRWRRTALIAAIVAALVVGCASAVAADLDLREAVKTAVRQIFQREVVSNPRLDLPAETCRDEEGNFLVETQEWTVKFNDGTTERYFAISRDEGGLNRPLFSDEWEAFSSRWNYTSDADAEEYPELGEWRLGWLPDGYAFEECEHTYNYTPGVMASAHFKDWDKVRIISHNLAYVTVDGNRISMQYRYTSGAMVLGIEEDTAIEELELNGVRIYFINNENNEMHSSLVWYDPENEIYFKLTGNLTGEELLNIAGSVFREK